MSSFSSVLAGSFSAYTPPEERSPLLKVVAGQDIFAGVLVSFCQLLITLLLPLQRRSIEQLAALVNYISLSRSTAYPQ